MDVTLRMGGPQVYGMQPLLAGEADVYTGYDFQVLSGVEKGLPVRAVAATFQHDVNGILTHEDVAGAGRLVFVPHSIYEAVFPSTHVAVMAARPGRISRIIDIDHAGRRDETFRGSPRFAALCSELSEALRDASGQSGEMGEPR
ncbi:ABC transporter substrate-binding protein [Mameliella alba]|uniref:ABC transporter substrate-binding protein n=1 Tax=Mameliella alba TaxID=561184 RepID=UPI00227ABD92|nr:ABC transporter substrate-binding protein [Mameliella alba]